MSPTAADMAAAFQKMLEQAVWEGDCLEFRRRDGGRPGGEGYGTIKVAGTTQKSHRLAYEHYHGPIPDGLLVRHHCDNPPCFRKEHLALGTSRDNVQDALDRGRWPAKGRRGSNNGKLTAAQVVEIRHLCDSGRSHPLAIAEQFGISRTAVRMIAQRENWRWVPECDVWACRECGYTTEETNR